MYGRCGLLLMTPPPHAVVYIRQAAVNRDKWVLLFTDKMKGVVPVLLVVRY